MPLHRGGKGGRPLFVGYSDRNGRSSAALAIVLATSAVVIRKMSSTMPVLWLMIDEPWAADRAIHEHWQIAGF